MNKLAVLIAAACGLVWTSSPALAAPCKTKGDPAAKVVMALPADRDPAFDREIVAAMQPAAVAKARAAKLCTRAHGLSGEDTDAFPRIYHDPNGGIAYLVPVTLKSGARAYAVIKAWGSGAVRLDGLFEAVPSDERLYPVINYFDDGGYDPLTLDARGRLVDSNNYINPGLAAAADRIVHPKTPPKRGGPRPD